MYPSSGPVGSGALGGLGSQESHTQVEKQLCG